MVNSEDLEGHSFAEQTESIDISSNEIAFYLETPISPRSFVSLEAFGYRGKVTGVVVRVEPSISEKNLVAAEFF